MDPDGDEPPIYALPPKKQGEFERADSACITLPSLRENGCPGQDGFRPPPERRIGDKPKDGFRPSPERRRGDKSKDGFRPSPERRIGDKSKDGFRPSLERRIGDKSKDGFRPSPERRIGDKSKDGFRPSLERRIGGGIAGKTDRDRWKDSNRICSPPRAEGVGWGEGYEHPSRSEMS